MLKIKVFSTTTVNTLISKKKKKKASLVLKENIIYIYISLLVDDCMLMY